MMEVEYKIIKRIVREGVFCKFYCDGLDDSITANVGESSVKLITTSVPRTSDCMKSLSIEYHRLYCLSIDGIGIEGLGSVRIKNALNHLISKSIAEQKSKQKEIVNAFTEAK